MFLPRHVSAVPFQMAIFTQLLWRRMTIRRRFAMARQEKQQHVATCCRCVAGEKGQRNPSKMGFVAVLPIFRTSIYQSCVSGQSWRRMHGSIMAKN
jgi:CHASE1-domain containing sensor protein